MSGAGSEKTNLRKAARIVSVIGHPFVLLPSTVLIAAVQNATPARAFRIVVVTVLVTVLPLLFIIRRKVATGKWADHDVSVPEERRAFYPILIGVVLLSCVIFRLLEFPRSLLIGMVISLALLAAAMFINLWSKISLHLIFAVYCAVSLAAVSYWISASFLMLAILVAWSRVVLERHSLAQVLSGMTLGTVAGLLLLKLVDFF